MNMGESYNDKKVFFNKKFLKKKTPGQFIILETKSVLPVKLYREKERNYLQVIKRWAEILDDRSYKSI